MDRKAEASGTHRVIALLSATAPAPRLHPEVELVRVNSGYEAAAEMLAGPASALVVDLGRITPPHVPLLSLAGQLAVPVVAFGAVCSELKADLLANMRLVTAEQTGQVVAEILRLPAAAPAVSVEQEAAAQPAAAAEEQAPAQAAAPAKLTPAKAQRPGQPLTQAELDALLGET